MGYANDRKWSDGLLNEVRAIVGPHLLTPAPLELDAKEATDLLVLQARDMRIAVRIRRPGFAERYPFEFTLRARRDSGAVTELSKIVEGWGDWLFYGHANGQDRIARWWLIDLSSFRAALIRDRGNLRMGDKPNGDGTYFKWFDLRSFPERPSILVAGSHPLPQRAAA